VTASEIRPPRIEDAHTWPGAVVALAASAGGPNALATVLSGLEGIGAGILVVQHIHRQFVDGFVDWMSRASALPVHVATDGAPIQRGVVYVGPPDVHLKLGYGMRIRLDPDPAATHRPSADELFRSVAASAPDRGIGVLLTGMGADGASGLLELRGRGGSTIVQDEGSSAVYGMPRAAALLGAADTILPLDEIAAAILRAVESRRR
jgi:two-component system, chemotaxis family, protein-glutamate methylesterase/glutaminase